MSECTFVNLKGLGYDPSSSDDTIITSSSYISDQSMVAF